MEGSRHKNNRNLTLDLKALQSTIWHHLKNKKKLEIWVPHTLSGKNKEDRISVTSLFFKA